MAQTTPFSVCKEFCAGTGGKSGTTFIPNVSPEGVISWTNDGGLKNPDPVTIKGGNGYTPQKGKDYFTDEDIEEIKIDVKEDLSKVATSGNYKDLSNKPIIESISEDITHDYNEFTTEGIYILREPYKERYKLLIVTTDNDHYDNETNTWYGYVVTQYLFSTYGVTKRMNLNDKWTGWEPVGGTDINIVDDINNISGDEEKEVIPSARAVKLYTALVQNDIIGYVDNAIGDIETSLENIIAKYGLGGDSV
jgi:hypothetical protein